MQQHGKTLDPSDWGSFRQQAHEMLDDMLGYLEHIRERPVWQTIPAEVRQQFRSSVPRQPSDLSHVRDLFLRHILPYGSGNVHPGFLGWVQGGGTPVGMLAEMLAAAMNSNLGGRDHIPIEVERQIVEWMGEVFGFPEGSTGLFVTGTSMANLIAVVVARDAALNGQPNPANQKLVAYASSVVHGCIAKALHASGIGRDSLRFIRTDRSHRIDLEELERTIEADRRAGLTPFLIVGTAGTVDIGAIDDLSALAEISRRQNVWFHVDGAYAALAALAPDLAPRLKGIERADSLAFDFHKWGQVPYPAGFLLVRHGLLHRESFACSAPYLRREGRGLAAGEAWPCDFGIDLSRGFQALKTWFTLKVFGADALGAVISESCALARYLEERVSQTPELELMAPVSLNIVCFRFRAIRANRVNSQIVVKLQESGEVAPSTTTIDGQLVIRAAIVNHRTTRKELDILVERTVAIGHSLDAGVSAPLEPDAEDWAPRRLNEAAIAELDKKIMVAPDAIELRMQRAGLLGDVGRTQEARDDYLAVLKRDPGHRVALNNVGTLLYGTGYRTAARTAYAEAVAKHPDDVTSLVNLANVLLQEGNAATARDHYAEALRLENGLATAHQGMARALSELGDEQAAEVHRKVGYANNSLAALPYRGDKRPVDVLLLVSERRGNFPVRHILDDRIFRTFALTADYYNDRETLPFHHVVFNSIGDADLAGAALVAAQSILAWTTAPVINDPTAVSGTGRVDNARRLRNVPGVVTPLTVTLPRAVLAGQDGQGTLALHGFRFPLLLRTPGFHTGRYFVKVENAAEWAACVAELPGEQLTMIQYMDARGHDGNSRKYRVMMVDGQLYPLHLAIAGHWKIHYYSADMADRPKHRAEDAAFLEDMPGVLGTRAMTALTHIQAMLGLDYGGIDFGLSEQGEVLLFEANATMVVQRPEKDDQWNYRWPAVRRIHSAVRNMVISRATSKSTEDRPAIPHSETKVPACVADSA